METFERTIAPEKKEKGRNCRLKISFLRHANKADFDPHKGGAISESGLSKKGEAGSQELGRKNPTDKFFKTYASHLERSQATIDNVALGMSEGKDDFRKPGKRIRSQIDAPHFSPAFIAEYRAHFTPKPDNFEELSDDEKEKIVEEMENPGVEYWIGLWDKKFDEETESAAEIAEKMASYFSHFDKLIGRLKDGSEVDILNVTHPTAVEPFFLACLKPPFKNIQEMGGPLNLLEDFELLISTDENGQKGYAVNFRGKEFGIDLEKVVELNGSYEARMKKNFQEGVE